MRVSLQTEREDWAFIVSATLVFALPLLVTLLDFAMIQRMSYRLGVGLVLFSVGVVMHLMGKRTMGRHYSYGLRTLPNHNLIKHRIYRHVRHPISLAAVIYSTGIPLVFSSL